MKGKVAFSSYVFQKFVVETVGNELNVSLYILLLQFAEVVLRAVSVHGTVSTVLKKNVLTCEI